MSDVEQLEAEYRKLATRVIYAGFKGHPDAADVARLEALGEEIRRRNSVGGSSRRSELAA